MKAIGTPSMHDLVHGAMHRAGIRRSVDAAMTVEACNTALEELFGNGIQEHAQGWSFVDGVLRIACVHAALAEELKLQTPALLDRIVRIVPSAAIQKVSVIHRDRTDRGAAWDSPR